MFSESERKIFRFHDGDKDRSVDPIATLVTFMSQPEFDAKADIANAQLGDMIALSRVIKAVRDTFKVKPYDEVDGKATGLLDNEVIELFSTFNEYMQDLQKKTPTSPTLPDITESLTESTTKQLSDCGSIEIAS